MLRNANSKCLEKSGCGKVASLWFSSHSALQVRPELDGQPLRSDSKAIQLSR